MDTDEAARFGPARADGLTRWFAANGARWDVTSSHGALVGALNRHGSFVTSLQVTFGRAPVRRAAEKFPTQFRGRSRSPGLTLTPPRADRRLAVLAAGSLAFLIISWVRNSAGSQLVPASNCRHVDILYVRCPLGSLRSRSRVAPPRRALRPGASEGRSLLRLIGALLYRSFHIDPMPHSWSTLAPAQQNLRFCRT